MAQLRFYNSLTHALDEFEPLRPPTVTMYNCGPTVYDFAHIGNFKTFLFADVLRRTLELFGHEVHQVMNLTDVGHMTDDQLADGGGEDKMQVAAQRLKEAKKAGQAHADSVSNPDDPYEVAEFYIQAFLDDYLRAGVRRVICTDVARDGMLGGPAVALYGAILARAPALELVASGGIRGLADVEACAAVGCAGAIVGKALYEGLM